MLQAKHPARNCLTCDKPVKGRSDKKFCDDYCRNNYNNHLKLSDSNIVRLINNVLTKNRRILQSLLPEDRETYKITRDNLLLKGFSFKYITHIYTTQTGKDYFYCYEYGYLPLDNDWFLIVKRKAE